MKITDIPTTATLTISIPMTLKVEEDEDHAIIKIKLDESIGFEMAGEVRIHRDVLKDPGATPEVVIQTVSQALSRDLLDLACEACAQRQPR